MGTVRSGTGHLWPVLSAERAEQDLQNSAGVDAAALLSGIDSFASGVGLIPEQDWELPELAPSPFGTDPTTASIGFVDGRPAGSAAPLTWSAASYVRLAADLRAGRVLDRPRPTTDRYVIHSQASIPLIVTSPADLSAVSYSPVTVTGTTRAGATIDVLGLNTDNNTAASSVSGTAPDGSFSVDVPVTPGTTVLSIAATAPDGSTAHATRTIVWDFVAGTTLLDVSDPSGDDNGPGKYAYPTAPDFHPGAFDLQRFQVIDSGSDIVFRVQTRDLSPTFGSPLGAQLVDIYVHDPNAAPADTSTHAAFDSRNYTIAQADAWSRLVEAQGFGQLFIDAHGNTVGQLPAFKANQISRFITITVPKSQLGQPGRGWAFTVVLTGQDGFSGDKARGFAATPQPFQFGVCPATSSDLHCTVGPGTVPKATDVITPSGVSQGDELDYTLHPSVVVQGVSIP